MQKKTLQFLLITGLMMSPQAISAETLQPPDIFRPPLLRGISYTPSSSTFNALLDKGSLAARDPGLQDIRQLFTHFITGITLPGSAFWVNLRPDDPGHMIDPALRQTDAGRIMLAADVQLKKDLAAFTSPRSSEGKRYWDMLYKKAGELFGSEPGMIPTVVRPWIVPGEILLAETQDGAYVFKATLKVMLEKDRVDEQKKSAEADPRMDSLNDYSAHLIRELIIPELTKAVNTERRYAQLRQLYFSLILAQWFKGKYASDKSAYGALLDRHDLGEAASREKWSPESYYDQYRSSFTNGEYRGSEQVSTTEGPVLRSYTSGGIDFSSVGAASNSFAARGLPDAGMSPVTVQRDGGVMVFRPVAPAPNLRARALSAPVADMAAAETELHEKFVAGMDSREFAREAMRIYRRDDLQVSPVITTNGRDFRFGNVKVKDMTGNDANSNIRIRNKKGTIAILGDGVSDPALRARAVEAVGYFLSLPELEEWSNYEALEVVIGIERIAGGGDADSKAKGFSVGVTRRMISKFREFIRDSSDRIEAAMRVSVLANSLDWADPAMRSLMEQGKVEGFLADQLNGLRRKAGFWENDQRAGEALSLIKKTVESGGKTILLCTDNAGEELVNIISVVPELLKNGNRVIIAGKTRPSRNDSTARDLRRILRDPRVLEVLGNGKNNVSVISTGSLCLGLDLGRSTPEFIRAWQEAALVIFFGQANYYTLLGMDLTKPAVHLLKVKWSVEAQGHTEGNYVLEARPSRDGGEKAPGGVDFRQMRPEIRSMNGLFAELTERAKERLCRIQLDKEWQSLERLSRTAARPSAERIEEYALASYCQGNLKADSDKIIGEISTILLDEEAECVPTDPVLKDTLLAIEAIPTTSHYSGETL